MCNGKGSGVREQLNRFATCWRRELDPARPSGPLLADRYARAHLRVNDRGPVWGRVQRHSKIEEFDPGSARTLAAWLKHASRTIKAPSGVYTVAKGRGIRSYVPRGRGQPRETRCNTRCGPPQGGSKASAALGAGNVLSGCWWGNGSPSRRRVAGVRARTAASGLRHCPDSYGRLQQRIFRNARKRDGAMPRAG